MPEPAGSAPARPTSPTPSEFLPLDETLLERANTQWRFGDWEGLAEIDLEALHHHPDRAKLALLAAEGHLQLGHVPEARALLKEAQACGVAPKTIHRMLIAGVYNTLGKASFLKGQVHEAMDHFSASVRIAMPGAEHRLSTKARALQQVEQLVDAAPDAHEFALRSREFAEALLPKPLNPYTNLISRTSAPPEQRDTLDSVANQPICASLQHIDGQHPKNTPSRPTLHHLYASPDGKVSDKWESYIDLYSHIFSAYRDERLSLLEIGIQNGGSLEVWSQYFPLATSLVGCDIDPKCGELCFTDKRIRIVIGDIKESTTVRELTDQLAKPPSIIIDDGSHLSSDIIAAFCQLFQRLTYGGVYVVEDLHCSYWPRFEGGLREKKTAMEFFKHLSDVLNFEHWQPQQTYINLKDDFERRFSVLISEEVFFSMKSIAFANSTVWIYKALPHQTLLGRRVFRGTATLVTKPRQSDSQR